MRGGRWIDAGDAQGARDGRVAEAVALRPPEDVHLGDVQQLLVGAQVFGPIQVIDVHGHGGLALRIELADAPNEERGIKVRHGGARLVQVGHDVAQFADAADALLFELGAAQAGDGAGGALHGHAFVVLTASHDDGVELVGFSGLGSLGWKGQAGDEPGQG